MNGVRHDKESPVGEFPGKWDPDRKSRWIQNDHFMKSSRASRYSDCLKLFVFQAGGLVDLLGGQAARDTNRLFVPIRALRSDDVQHLTSRPDNKMILWFDEDHVAEFRTIVPPRRDVPENQFLCPALARTSWTSSTSEARIDNGLHLQMVTLPLGTSSATRLIFKPGHLHG